MVDHFGRSVIGQQLRGLPGESGIKALCTVLPGTVIANLRRYDEPFCFTINKPTTDFIDGNTKWISRDGNGNKLTLTTEQGTIKLRELNLDSRWSIVMKNAMFICHSITFSAIWNCVGFYYLTFFTKSDAEQVVISTFHDERHDYSEIRCTASEIVIKCGKFEEIIQHNVRRWTTLYLEYNAGNHLTDWRYIIDNNPLLSGTFASPTPHRLRTGLTMGARRNSPGKENYFEGEIASFEAYQQDGTNIKRDDPNSPPLCNTTPVPGFLRDLVYKYQKVEEDFYSFAWLDSNVKEEVVA